MSWENNYNHLVSNLLNSRQDYLHEKEQYLEFIKEYCYGAIDHPRIEFRKDRMYLMFESFSPMSDRFMLKFCNELGFLAPIIEFKELSESFTLYKFKFIKLLR